MANKLIMSPYYMFRACECSLGIVCFSLFTYYSMLFNIKTGDSVYMALVKEGIAFVAADAFPYIVQIPFIIAYFHHGKVFQHNILNPIVNLIGGLVYIIAGANCLSTIGSADDIYPFDKIPEFLSDAKTQQTAVGAMFVVTGCVYVCDLVFWCVKLRRNPDL